jgi:hypothetical protein
MKHNIDKAIIVWRWEDAPDEYRNLSEHGGDEDYVAFIPLALEGHWIGWLEEGQSFGCCSVSEHRLRDGTVKIGAHA